MRFRSLVLLPLLAASALAMHCGGSTPLQSTPPEAGTPLDEAGVADADTDAGGKNPDAIGATTASKVDLLLVVDNSASMGDKAKLLGGSLSPLLKKVAEAGDVHFGVINSSLGGMGGDICANSGAQNSLAHLSSIGPGGTPLASAAQGFLSYGGGGATNIDTFIADAATLVNGIGETGCGLEAQLESTYRFLVQPDPWQTVTLDARNVAQLSGVDATLLAQRKAFLRPDSLVVVVVLTDEDDSTADPRSLGGQGWAFMANQFPGSPVFRADGKTTTAPRGTSACASNPGSPDCTSCGYAATCNPSDAACQKIKADPECQKNGGYWGATEEQINVRFHRMKERFGIDPQFPLSRYADGFTKLMVPDREGEHGEVAGVVGPYVGTPKCTNPLFAASLPGAAGDELCNLPKGPRGKDLVVFAVLGGVPNQLVGAAPAWDAILGADPEAFDYTGIDPHMIQSRTARAGLPAPTATRGDNGTDPTNGREWDTAGNDLQFACTFDLPTPRNCTNAQTSCDCADPAKNPPLCGATLGDQIKAKAYPTPRELLVVKKLGDRGIAGSICPTSAASGYDGTMATLASRLASRIVK
jgi:hypothetical protein